MRIASPARILSIGAIAVSVGVVAATIAFGGASAREETALGHRVHAHGHALPRLPLGLESFGAPPDAGSRLLGTEIVAHFEGGHGARRHPGSGGGQMIYTGVTAAEPTMGIDKKGQIFYQGMDFSRFPLLPIVVVSRDGGRSWDDVTPPTHLHTQDPMLYVDRSTGRVFTADLTFPCTTVSHNDDVEGSWTTSQACGLTDHQNVFTGPPVESSTTGYPNIVYLCAIDGGALADASTATSCLKSLDGGIAWVRTGAPAYTSDPRQEDGNRGIRGFCDGGTGHGFVDSKGVVYLPRGWCGRPYLAISKDEGATWERVRVTDRLMPRHPSGVFEHEAAVAVDERGNIYYFWTSQNRLPYLTVSTDGGKHFSKPMMIGPPGLKESWGPTIEIGDTGKIALAYVGSTNAPGGDSPDGFGPEYTEEVTWNGYITTSIDALSKKPRFFTASVNPRFDPIMRGECGVIRCGAQLDFIDVVIGPDGAPWTSMVDGWCLHPADPCPDIGQGFVGTVMGGPKLR